jgi:hypothetical protein
MIRRAPPTPDDPLPDLEARLAALHALGPMELKPEERTRMEREWNALDEVSKQAMDRLANG